MQPGGLSEVALPESTRWIDLLQVVDEPSDAWGPVRADLAQRSVVLEHFSRPPSPRELTTALLKATWALERWHRAGRDAPRPPLGLVLSVGRPRAALEFFTGLHPAEPSGIYRTREGHPELLLVDVRNLAPVDGTSFLRLLDHRAAVAGENLRRLQEDSSLSTLTQELIGDAILSNPMVFKAEERILTARELRTQGHAEGLAKGRAEEARALAKRALVVRLGDPLPAVLAKALRRCADADALGALVELAVRGGPEKELLAQARRILQSPRRSRTSRRSKRG